MTSLLQSTFLYTNLSVQKDVCFSSHVSVLLSWSRLYQSIYYAVYPKKYAHGFYFAVLCCGYTLTDFPISIRLTSLALWQSNNCPSASKATLMNMDKYFMWIHYERLHNHNKAKHNKTVCIFLGIYCMIRYPSWDYFVPLLACLFIITWLSSLVMIYWGPICGIFIKFFYNFSSYISQMKCFGFTMSICPGSMIFYALQVKPSN